MQHEYFIDSAYTPQHKRPYQKLSSLLRSTTLRLRLTLLSISLLQPRHPSLTHLRIPGIKPFEISWRNNRRQLDLGVFLDRFLLDLVRFGFRGTSVSI